MGAGEGWDLPPGAEPWSDFHWFRCSPRKSLVLVILSETPMWYTGHYVDGRMWPCCGDECQLCKEGVAAQVRYVLAAAETSTKRVGIIEVGRGIGLQVKDWSMRNGGLKGMHLEFMKHSHSKQSRTEVNYIDEALAPWWRMCPVPDIRKALILTWRKANMPLPESMKE